MGGKTKTSQRTKNNARPSSSGRSAELLNTAKAEQYFGAGSGPPVLFPSLATLSLDQGLTAEYSVCFKKFTKKDPVTKTKALQELTQLVTTGDVADAEAALPSWAHHYQSLSIDSDRRVREATQTCHGAVVSACGRRAAPQLRRLLPAWLLALHDEHAPAGSVAHKHLQNTFPDGKLPEALSFCKAEIMGLLSDNLAGNADAMVGKRIEDPDERQSVAARVLASSLHALQLLLSALPAAHTDWLWDSHVAALLQHNYFWGLARHQSQPIRAAWYGAVGRIIERFGARIPLQVGKKAAKALVAEPERNAGVAAQRWAALLLLMRHVEEWHLWLEKKDLLITRLLDMIENGAWGSARLLSSTLVPLLARLPAEVLTKHFYIKLFDAMFTGLNTKNLLNSKSERQTWISNLAECLRYLSTQSHEFAIEVITYAHRTWLERVLNIKESQARTNLIRHSMTHMSSLIKHWLNQSKAEKEKYDQLTRNFWQNICSTILTQIDKLSIEQEDIVQAIESHILLLKTLQTSFLNEPKKKMSIQFEDQKIDLSKIDDTTIEKLDVSCDEQGRERFKHNLNDLVQKTCCSYFDFAYKKQVSRAVCPVLTNLLIEFDSRELFASAAKHFEADSVYGFYDKALRPWLAGDTMRCEALVEMVFLVVKYMSEEEQDSMFSSFQQFPPPVVEWCMRLSLSHPHSGLAAGRRWLRGPVAQASVLALSRREGDSQAKSLLLMCMAPDDAGEVMVGESAVALVVGEISSGLESETAPCNRARVAAQLAGVLARGAARAYAGTLLSPLLRYRLRLTGRYAVEFGNALVWDAWRDALPALPARLRDDLLTRALRDVCDRVLHDMKELDIPRLDDAASCCPHMLGASEDNEPNITEIVSLTGMLFAQLETKQPTTPLEFYALRCDCIHGNIIPAFERNNELCKKIASESEKNHEELSKDDLMVSVYKSLFRVYFLRRITQNIPDSDVKSNAWCNRLLSECHFKEVFGYVMYDYAVINTLYEYYAFWPHYEIIYQTKNQMESQIEDILADITIETKNSLYSFLTELFAKQGPFYWPFARKLFDIKFNKVTAKIKEQENKIPENPHIRKENEDDDLEKDTSENLEKIHHNDISELESPLQSGKSDSETATEEEMFSSEPDQENIEFSTLELGFSQAELIDLKSRSEQSKTEFKPEQSETESKTEQSKTESKSEQSITESKTEQSKTKSKTEHGETESKSEQIKTVSKIEHGETESKSDQSKSEAKPEHSETESKTEHGETESKSEQIKTESKKEHGETESKSDQSKSEAKPEHSETESKTEHGETESKSEQIQTESKKEHGETESKSDQIKSEAKPEQSKTESKPEHSTFESASDHYEECKNFVDKSAHVDDESWGISLGFPTLQEVASNSWYYLNLEAEAKYSPDAERDCGVRYKLMMRSALSAHMYSPSVVVQLLADMVEGLNPCINGYYNHGKAQSLLLADRELTGVPWGHVMSNAAVLDYLSDMVAGSGLAMDDFYWDFVNIGLSSLLDSVRRTAHRWGTTNVSCLLRASVGLLARVSAFKRELCRDPPAPPLDQVFNTLLEEWHDIFEPDLNKQLFTVLLTVLRSTDTPVTASSVATIGCLIEATRHMDFDALSRASGLEPTLTMEALAEAAIQALRGMTHHAYKYLAFYTLQLIARPLVYEDAQKLELWNAREEGVDAPRPAMCLALFHDAMTQLQDYTEAALSNVALCEGTCEMVPFSDSHRVSLGYLLLAAALLRLCGLTCGDLHQVYTAEFRDRMYAEGLMSCTLRLLPAPVAAFAFVRGAPLTAPALHAFRALPALDVYERCSGGTVSALACYVLTETLGGPGAADARSWSGSRPPLCAAALRRLVPVAVAPVLLRRHLLQLKRRGHELPGARISINWARAEVQCWIELEEHELELCIRFAPEHPLVPPSVTSPPSSPTPNTSWIRMYLTYQNGTLLNALKMWIRAVNWRVQCAPQCYVCYCRMHPTSGRFPGVLCHQCRNKFHYACLSKWFMHSQKANCPLCRTKF